MKAMRWLVVVCIGGLAMMSTPDARGIWQGVRTEQAICTSEDLGNSGHFDLEVSVGDPASVSGSFPVAPEASSKEALKFEFDAYESGGVYFGVDSYGLVIDNFYYPEWEALPMPTFPLVAQTVRFLERLSLCVATGDPAMLEGFFSSYGKGWVCADGDPFMTAMSPVAGLCHGTARQALQWLPWELVEMRQLRDGRIAALIGMDSPGFEGDRLFNDQAHASIMILTPTDHGTVIEAVVGGFNAFYVEWIDISVQTHLTS